MKNTLLIGLLLLLPPQLALADAVVRVEALNYPVWIERGQQVIPLLPGSSLRNGDLIRTGHSGRAWLAMADGSVIKLGESAKFRIDQAGYAAQDKSETLQAALDVIRGAFRFTTAFFQPRRKSSHQVTIKVGSITAGVRGTDIWGRADDNEDFVTLLEGTISVEAEGESRVQLSEPLSLYSKQRGQSAAPITLIEQDRVSMLAQETELSESLGIARQDGRYELVLTSLRSSANTRRALSRFQHKGYAVQSMAVEKDGEQFIRLFVGGLQNIAAANNLGRRMQEEFGLQETWVNQRR